MSNVRTRAAVLHWVLPGVALVAYLGYVHLQILRDQTGPAAFAWIFLLSLVLGVTLLRRSWGAALILGAALAAGLALATSDAQPFLLFAPPVLINLTLALMFGLTLRPGHTPLITRFARALDGELDVPQQAYTRSVTWAWTAMFAFLAVESVLLALFAPLWLWSLFANGINYLLVGALFVVEYRIRVRHLAHLDHPGLVGFLGALRRLNWRELMWGEGR